MIANISLVLNTFPILRCYFMTFIIIFLICFEILRMSGCCILKFLYTVGCYIPILRDISTERLVVFPGAGNQACAKGGRERARARTYVCVCVCGCSCMGVWWDLCLDSCSVARALARVCVRVCARVCARSRAQGWGGVCVFGRRCVFSTPFPPPSPFPSPHLLATPSPL